MIKMKMEIANNVRRLLLFIIAGACTVWVAYWFVSPEPQDYPKHLDKLDPHIKSRFFRTDSYFGSVLLYQALPFVLVAVLGYAVIFLRTFTREQASTGTEPDGKKLRLRFGTYPLWVKSPLGVLTAADVVFIAAVLIIMLYHLGRELHLDFQYLEDEYKTHTEDFEHTKVQTRIAWTGYWLGNAAMVPFCLLWIPVSRGSPFLRLVGVPFEHAVKYHIWLGVLTMLMLTLHGIFYVVFYIWVDEANEILGWETEGESCSIVAGIVALAAGLAMWITSLSYFRRKWYEVFFGVHHLYIVFVLFWIYHVPWTIHFISMPILLFVVDRFLRFIQSRQAVDVLSARVMESGAVELTFATNGYIQQKGSKPVYNALSSWYLKFPSLPKSLRLQWHFFSVMSSPIDKKREFSIVIKPLGGWTNSLRDQLTSMQEQKDEASQISRCPFSFKAAIEGPYGDETKFYLQYKSLVLVGGGIGVTPLLAILRDILHRYKRNEEGGNHGYSNLPTSIQLYHCMRTPEELCVLNSIDPCEILHDYDHRINIQVHAFVTSHNLQDTGAEYSTPEPHRGVPLSTTQVKYDLATSGGTGSVLFSNGVGKSPKQQPIKFWSHIVGESSKAKALSPISPTGHAIWLACVTIVSITGYYVMWGLTNVFWIQHADDKFPNYSRAHLILACMLVGTFVFGGGVVVAWYFCGRRRYRSENSEMVTQSGQKNDKNVAEQEPHEIANDEEQSVGGQSGSPWNGSLCIGSRPIWEEVFQSLMKEYEGQNVGVLVSGGSEMQEEVANQCKKHTTIGLKYLVGTLPQEKSIIFHYHSVSFEL